MQVPGKLIMTAVVLLFILFPEQFCYQDVILIKLGNPQEVQVSAILPRYQLGKCTLLRDRIHGHRFTFHIIQYPSF